MSAFATVIAPFDRGSAIELGNRLWKKRILPVGSISYQGRTLNFTPGYLAGLAAAFRDRAYDQVSFQLADSQNAHTNDPERHRGTVTDMTVESDGLYVVVDPTERGEAVLRENPYLGISARIVEQFQRADGQFYPAAIQHVLGTLDPRIPALGSWQPIEMANQSAVTIDLSSYSFAGEPAPAYASASDELTDAELDDLIDVMTEVEGMYDGTEAQMYDDSYADAAEGFDAAFTARYAAEQAREAARAGFELLDAMRPAVRMEDKVARAVARAEAGLYDGQLADFTADAAAVEITLANGGAGPCGPADEFGRCSARYHALECGHGQTVDWAFSNPPASTGEAALANLADRMQLDLAPRSVWGDPDDPDEPGYEVPQHTIELAHQLATDWGLGTDGPGPSGALAYADPLRLPAAPVSVADALYEGMGYEMPPTPRPSYPGIRELAEQLGLR